MSASKWTCFYKTFDGKNHRYVDFELIRQALTEAAFLLHPSSSTIGLVERALAEIPEYIEDPFSTDEFRRIVQGLKHPGSHETYETLLRSWILGRSAEISEYQVKLTKKKESNRASG